MKTQNSKMKCFSEVRKKQKNSQISRFGFQYVGRKGDSRFVLHIKCIARFDK